ncbi:MAG: hypothetical protein K5773_03880, partial [Pseudobutyrivibrio sp.]|nr:hypothetical protein [Pseudobutyrivibrio sp.]
TKRPLQGSGPQVFLTIAGKFKFFLLPLGSITYLSFNWFYNSKKCVTETDTYKLNSYLAGGFRR